MVLRAIGLTFGLLVGASLFEALSRLLSGMPHGWLWHLGIAAGAAIGLWLSWHAGGCARLALIATCLALLGLTAASALVFPALVRSWAGSAAGGNAWCLLGPDRRNGDYEPRKLSYLVTAPLGGQDLTYLVLPDPLVMVAESEATDLNAKADDPALQVWTLDIAGRGFIGPDQPVLDLDRTSMLLDCVPAADPLAGAADPEIHPVTVFWRPALAGTDGEMQLGPRQRDVFNLPAGAIPLRGSRLVSAVFGVSLALKPGAAALPVELQFWTDTAGALQGELAGHLRVGDQSVDFASLPLDALGLRGLDYPSTSVAGAMEGIHAALAPDGSPETVIACDEYFCRQSFQPELPGHLPLVVSVTYPLEFRPGWQGIEQAAKAQVQAMLAPR